MALAEIQFETVGFAVDMKDNVYVLKILKKRQKKNQERRHKHYYISESINLGVFDFLQTICTQNISARPGESVVMLWLSLERSQNFENDFMDGWNTSKLSRNLTKENSAGLHPLPGY